MVIFNFNLIKEYFVMTADSVIGKLLLECSYVRVTIMFLKFLTKFGHQKISNNIGRTTFTETLNVNFISTFNNDYHCLS